MQHADFVAVSSIEMGLLPMEVLHCGNTEFCTFLLCDFDLDTMTIVYELDPYLLNVYSQTKN